MLKKIVLVALFVASAAIATTGTVSAHSVTISPEPNAPQGFCAVGIFCG